MSPGDPKSARNPEPGWLIAEGDGRRRLVSEVDHIGIPQVRWERPTLSGRRQTQWMSLERWNKAADRGKWTLLMQEADTINHCPSSDTRCHDLDFGESRCPACGWESPTPLTASFSTRSRL